MELSKLKGNIIGVISNEYNSLKLNDGLVKDIIGNKYLDALKIVNLDSSFTDKNFNSLSLKEKNIVLLASKLNEKVIILEDFSNGLIYKDLEFYKKLLKKISSYDKKIILISKDINLFMNLVDTFYCIDKDSIVYSTTDIFDHKLYDYISKPPIIEFREMAKDKGINLVKTLDFNDLLKDVYRAIK